MALLSELIDELFVGFGIFILATSFVSFNDGKRNELIINLTDSSIIIIRFAAIGYLIIWLTYYQSEGGYYSIMNRLTGPYWLAYCIYPICYGILPQLLWMERIRSVKTVRIIISCLFLFVIYIEKLIIVVTSLHRDYVPSSWAMFPSYFILYDWFMDLLVFTLVLTCIHFVKVKMANTKVK